MTLTQTQNLFQLLKFYFYLSGTSMPFMINELERSKQGMTLHAN